MLKKFNLNCPRVWWPYGASAYYNIYFCWQHMYEIKRRQIMNKASDFTYLYISSSFLYI